MSADNAGEESPPTQGCGWQGPIGQGSTTAAIYCRAPTAEPGDAALVGLDEQEAACRAYAAAHGHAVAERHVFREAAWSALDLRGRPTLTALRKSLRVDAVDTVICYLTHALTPDPALLSRLVRAHGVMFKVARVDSTRRRFFAELTENPEVES